MTAMLCLLALAVTAEPGEASIETPGPWAVPNAQIEESILIVATPDETKEPAETAASTETTETATVEIVEQADTIATNLEALCMALPDCTLEIPGESALTSTTATDTAGL